MKIIEEAVAILQEGGIILYPTDTLYGLGADAFNREAVAKIRAIKGRSGQKPFPIIFSNREEIFSYIDFYPAILPPLLETFWPGPLTVVHRVKPTFPTHLQSSDGMVGFRVPEHQEARLLVEKLGRPIIATSANLISQPPLTRLEDLNDDLRNQVDLVLTQGEKPAGDLGSTVIKVSTNLVDVLREGVIPTEEILDFLDSLSE